MTKLPAALEFHYEQFAKTIIRIEDHLNYWELQMDNAGDIGRLQRCTEEIAELEADLQKIYEVAGMLGLSKDILDKIHTTTFKTHVKEALA